MKKKRLILMSVLGLTGFIPMLAQLPETSTAESPKWYYIQVVGDEARSNLVFTLQDGGKVDGKAISTSTDMDEIEKQLWRFEQNAKGRYTIINYASGEELDVAYDADEGTARAVVVPNASATFALQALGKQYQIVSSLIPEGGASGEYYLHQGNGGYDWAVIMVGTNYSSGASSQFHFVPFVDPRITLSDDETETWYNLSNGSSTYGTWLIKENTDADSHAKLVLEEAESTDPLAQWKAVKANRTGAVRLINRATGHALGTESAVFGAFNLLGPSTVITTGNAWTPTCLGNLQYAFYAREDDAVTRYLGATAETAAASDEVDEDALAGSVYSWQLRPVETVATGLTGVSSAAPAIRVQGRRIIVSGGADCRICTVAGMAVSAGSELQPGIYIVTVAGKSTKVLIR